METKNTLNNKQIIRIAQRLRELRKEKKLTYDGLKEALDEKYNVNIGVTTLKNYEATATDYRVKTRDVAGMNIGYLHMFADFYNVPTDYLLGRPNAVRTTDANSQIICKITGLSEEAVKALIYLKHGGCSYIFSKLIEQHEFAATMFATRNWLVLDINGDKVYSVFDLGDQNYSTLWGEEYRKYTSESKTDLSSRLSKEEYKHLHDGVIARIDWNDTSELMPIKGD